MVSSTDHDNAISIEDSPQKLKLEKVHGALIILFYIRLSSALLQSCFKENANILSKRSTIQENITILIQNLLFFIKKSGKIPNLVLKRML